MVRSTHLDAAAPAPRTGQDILDSATPTWPALLPHGGGAVAILIAGIAMAVIAATIALEQQRRHVFAWAVTAFVATLITASAVTDILTAGHH